MVLEYVAAAAAGHVRANAQPVSLQTVVLSLGAEEDASFASLATHRLALTVQAVATLTAVELVCSARALRMQGRKASEFSNPLLRRALEAGFMLPAANQDRDLRPDVDRALKLVRLPALASTT
jgi:histidine ammonia-lyase